MQDEKYILIQKQKELNEAIRVYRKDPKSFDGSKRLIDATKVEDFDWNMIQWLSMLEETSTEAIIQAIQNLLDFKNSISKSVEETLLGVFRNQRGTIEKISKQQLVSSIKSMIETMRKTREELEYNICKLFKARKYNYFGIKEMRDKLTRYGSYRSEAILIEFLKASNAPLHTAIMFGSLETVVDIVETTKPDLKDRKYMVSLFFSENNAEKGSEKNRQAIYTYLLSRGAPRIVLGPNPLEEFITRKNWFYLQTLFASGVQYKGVFPNDICEGNIELFKYILFRIEYELRDDLMTKGTASVLTKYLNPQYWKVEEDVIDAFVALGCKTDKNLLIKYANINEVYIDTNIIVKIVSILKQKFPDDFNINGYDKHGRSVAFYASLFSENTSHQETFYFFKVQRIFETLISLGYDINTPSINIEAENGSTILNRAIIRGNYSLVRFLFDNGANPNLNVEELDYFFENRMDDFIFDLMVENGLKSLPAGVKNRNFQTKFYAIQVKRRVRISELQTTREFIQSMQNENIDFGGFERKQLKDHYMFLVHPKNKWLIHYYDIFKAMKRLQMYLSMDIYWEENSSNLASSSSSQ